MRMKAGAEFSMMAEAVRIFSKEAGTMLAENLLDEGESMVQLMAYSDALVAVAGK